jgi:hypothetical protein
MIMCPYLNQYASYALESYIRQSPELPSTKKQELRRRRRLQPQLSSNNPSIKGTNLHARERRSDNPSALFGQMIPMIALDLHMHALLLSSTAVDWYRQHSLMIIAMTVALRES